MQTTPLYNIKIRRLSASMHRSLSTHITHLGQEPIDRQERILVVSKFRTKLGCNFVLGLNTTVRSLSTKALR